MSSKPHLLQDMVLQCIRPLVALLIRQGVTYPSFAVALKTVFLDAAQQELKKRQHSVTDSALSVLSGVHRRDIRNMLRGPAPEDESTKATSVASQVVALWLSDSRYCTAEGNSLPLVRAASAAAASSVSRAGKEASFEDLVLQVTTDVRTRTVLDELLRLGVVREEGEHICLVHEAFVPTKDLQAMARMAQVNLYDHAAAATSNIDADTQSNFLEQAVFVDEISAASAQSMHVHAAKAWKATQAGVLRQAMQYFEQDRKQLPPEQRSHRIRFGVYFYSEDTNTLSAEIDAESKAKKSTKPAQKTSRKVASPATPRPKKPRA